MRRTKPSVTMCLAPMAVALLMGLAGCVGEYGGDPGPEWDGGVAVYGRGDGGYRGEAFRNEGGRHPASAGSARGRSSMGARAGGGGHAPSGGGGHASGGGHK
jgi:hypothetical protein